MSSRARSIDQDLLNSRPFISNGPLFHPVCPAPAAVSQTLYTDGNGSQWWDTYNSRSLQVSRVEASTAAYTTAADSTFTLAYDADQDQVTETEPGGVTRTWSGARRRRSCSSR